MLNNYDQQSHPNQDLIYQVRVKGHLGRRWANWLKDVKVHQEKNGETIITCTVADQSALFGLLRKVRDLGLPLISVICVES